MPSKAGMRQRHGDKRAGSRCTRGYRDPAGLRCHDQDSQLLACERENSLVAVGNWRFALMHICPPPVKPTIGLPAADVSPVRLVSRVTASTRAVSVRRTAPRAIAVARRRRSGCTRRCRSPRSLRLTSGFRELRRCAERRCADHAQPDLKPEVNHFCQALPLTA